jgi:hypothetical protein
MTQQQEDPKNLDTVKFRISGDFNDIRLDNVQKIFPNWFGNTLTVEPTNQNLHDSGYIPKDMTENEIDEAKNELMDQQREIMWSTLFEAKDNTIKDWILENHEKIITEAGFTIIDLSRENEGEYETGVFLGVNGAGYDFYEAHWIPLYKIFGVIK